MSLFWHRALISVVIALGLLHIYYLWRGFGLARTLWLWFSVLTLPFYFFEPEVPESSQAEQLLSYFDLAFSLFMVVWLNLPNVKAHFTQRKTVE